MTPMLEDIVLMNILNLIDSRLPAFIRSHYNHKMKTEEKLMDFKADILVSVPQFMETIENNEQNCSISI